MLLWCCWHCDEVHPIHRVDELKLLHLDEIYCKACERPNHVSNELKKEIRRDWYIK